MRDHALRGINCLLIDRTALNAGASGGNHGLLHSGGRYASADSKTAAECHEEGEIITNTRVSNRVINRLRPPGDGDILVPGGTVSVLGTTSDTVASPDHLKPTVEEVDRNLIEGMRMVTRLEHTRFIRAFSGVRPLVKTADAEADGRKASRGFTLLGHEDQGVSNFATITGGKLTIFRLMAEKSANLVAARLGNAAPCKTTTEPLPGGDAVRWTEPGFAARFIAIHRSNWRQ